MTPELAMMLAAITRAGFIIGIFLSLVGTGASIVTTASLQNGMLQKAAPAAMLAMLAAGILLNTATGGILDPPGYTLTAASIIAVVLACSAREPNAHTAIWTEAVLITVLNQGLGYPAWGLPAAAILGGHLAFAVTRLKAPGGFLGNCSSGQACFMVGLDAAALAAMGITAV